MVALGVRGNNMALLTEEQVEEILLIIENEVNVEWPETMFEMLCEWNEKQTTQQFELDWSKAPKDAAGALLNLTWLFKDQTGSISYGIAHYDRPAPVITPHPHADIMAKYAEVAARRDDPWVEFEWRDFDKTWRKAGEMISFSSHTEYRYIGDDK